MKLWPQATHNCQQSHVHHISVSMTKAHAISLGPTLRAMTCHIKKWHQCKLWLGIGQGLVFPSLHVFLLTPLSWQTLIDY
jgi:hypothetical protein